MYQSPDDRDWLEEGFPNDDGIIYQYTGITEEFDSDTSLNVGYDLVSINDLWKRRFDD